MSGPSVVVVGGGLAGLAAARHLADAGADVVLFERRDRVGGRVRSDRVDGFVLDRGFQVLFTAYPAARRELDVAALDLRRFASGATVCRPGHRSVLADPLADPGALLETLASDDATLRDKLRLLRWRLAAARGSADDAFAGPDRTVEAELRARGFSDRVIRNFFRPFYGGITLDPSLSTSASILRFTVRMLARGRAAVPAAGMGAIPAQMADRARAAGARIETGCRVTGVDAGAPTVRTGGETVDADAVVVATDPPAARALTGVDAVPAAGRGCVTQYYRFPGTFSLDSGGRLLLNAGEEGPNHVVPHSAVAPEHAPADATLVSATFLDEDPPDDDVLAASTAAALRAWYPERSVPDPTVLRTDRVEFAQVAQPPGFDRHRPDARAPAGEVYLAGDYTHTSSIDGALRSGRAAAAAVLADVE